MMLRCLAQCAFLTAVCHSRLVLTWKAGVRWYRAYNTKKILLWWKKKVLIFYGDKTEEGKGKRLSPISNYWIIPISWHSGEVNGSWINSDQVSEFCSLDQFSLKLHVLKPWISNPLKDKSKHLQNANELSPLSSSLKKMCIS